MSEEDILARIDSECNVRAIRMTKAIHNPDKMVHRVPTKLVHIILKKNMLTSHLVTNFERLIVKPKI